MVSKRFQTDSLSRAVVVVPAANSSTCRFIPTYRIRRQEHNESLLNTIQAALSLSTPVKIGPSAPQVKVVSGVIGLRNPSREAIQEAKRIFGEERRVCLVISLGSGQEAPPTVEKNMPETWKNVVLSSQRVTDELFYRFSPTSFYHRLSVDRGMENIPPLKWDDALHDKVVSHTIDYLQRISPSLDAIVDSLLNRTGSYTLGQICKLGSAPSY
jgi:hypothetical protein